MQNNQIRELLKEYGIRHWQLADKLNISESTLCKKLRKELSDSEKYKAIEAIESLKRGD